MIHGAILVLFLIALCPCQSFARVCMVHTGDDLNAAVTRCAGVKESNMVVVATNTRVSLNKPLDISSGLRLTCEYGAVIEGAGFDSIISISNASGVQIDGCTIDGKQSTQYGVRIPTGTNPVLSRLKLGGTIRYTRLRFFVA